MARDAGRVIAGIALVVAVAISGGAQAWAAGTLDFSPGGPPSFPSFAPIVLSGSPQLTSLSLAPFTVTDSTGSGSGWHVVLTISDLTLGSDDIPASSYVMAAPTIAGVNGADTTNVNGFGSTGNFATGETIVSAAVGYGEGTYLICPQPILLVVRADASAGTYVASASIDLQSGP